MKVQAGMPVHTNGRMDSSYALAERRGVCLRCGQYTLFCTLEKNARGHIVCVSPPMPSTEHAERGRVFVRPGAVRVMLDDGRSVQVWVTRVTQASDYATAALARPRGPRFGLYQLREPVVLLPATGFAWFDDDGPITPCLAPPTDPNDLRRWSGVVLPREALVVACDVAGIAVAEAFAALGLEAPAAAPVVEVSDAR